MMKNRTNRFFKSRKLLSNICKNKIWLMFWINFTAKPAVLDPQIGCGISIAKKNFTENFRLFFFREISYWVTEAGPRVF
jgi:hypothetical protein